ncbi:hypothetical protein ACS7SF_09950 [Ralstonia sp. 25C]|uniref:hypothetical protein n=1 Tax=Ralstonia sp. 25C TaxID=3447363 RepID=UPI003F754424
MVCLTVVLLALLALGVYWWKFRKDKPRHPPTRPPEAAWRPDPRSFDPYGDEWESLAPYPEHVTRAVHQAHAFGRVGRHAAAFPPSHNDARFDARQPDQEAPEEEDLWKASQQESYPTPSPPASEEPGSTQVRCPHCRSTRVEALNLARKAGSTIGSVAGATSGVAMAISGAEMGATVGAVGGPIGSIFGGLAGAVIAGLVGSAAGCAAGSAVGAAIDDNVLQNHLCRACGHAFNIHQE